MLDRNAVIVVLVVVLRLLPLLLETDDAELLHHDGRADQYWHFFFVDKWGSILTLVKTM